MRKVLGVFFFFCVLVIVVSVANPRFLGTDNLRNQGRWIGEFGIVSLGEGLVIITGGIDLSVGSVIALVATALPLLLTEYDFPVLFAVICVLSIATSLGLIHGLLITKMRLQPFVVTLCGLFVYRGVTRVFAGDLTQGYGTGFETLFLLVKGHLFGLPMPLVLLLCATLVIGVFLHRTVHGRYLLALGRNEQAARYSGIRTDRMIIIAYTLCGTCAGVSGVLLSLDINSMQPSNFGSFYELYAIAAAVLGGCSLRGGEGHVLGIVLGTAILRILLNAIILLRIPSSAEFAVIGGVLLLGVTTDEFVKRYAARRRAAQRAPS
jgi:ribose transport system permease protein